MQTAVKFYSGTWTRRYAHSRYNLQRYINTRRHAHSRNILQLHINVSTHFTHDIENSKINNIRKAKRKLLKTNAAACFSNIYKINLVLNLQIIYGSYNITACLKWNVLV